MTTPLPDHIIEDSQTSNQHGFSTQPKQVPRIESDKKSIGPVTKARYQRSLSVYVCVFLAGTLMSWFAGPNMAAFGLGLTFPGAGFLLYATGDLMNVLMHGGLFLGTVVSMLIALFLWVATGNLIAPVTVWFGSALYAGLMHHHHQWTMAPFLVPAAIVALGLVLYIRARSKTAELQLERDRINRYLDGKTTETTPLDSTTGVPIVSALPADSTGLLRYILDRALQPIDEFNGFDRIDEFREAAKRYQLCNSSYALSLYQYNHTPAFRGYLSEAQQNLALKMQDHRCWSYWRYENMWGNLRTNPDPMAFDNIMYYGWYGAMLGMMASNEDHHPYSQPGSIRLEHPGGEVFEYSFHDVCEIMFNNFTNSEFCLFPCEPRWIYPMCNNFGAVSLLLHDRLYGTDYWARIKDRYLKNLADEFVTLDGRILAIRDYRTGFTVPGLTSSMADAAAAYFMSPIAPELSRRSWEILRHDFIKTEGSNIHLETNGWDNIDFGNYRRSKATTYGLIAAAAKEVGDTDIARLMLDKLDMEQPSRRIDGIEHYPGASVSAHAVIFCARNMKVNGLHDLIAVGMPEPWKKGPLLAQASYPDVLVTRAVSDGAALDLELVPGNHKTHTTLGISQLVPGKSYRMTGTQAADLQADRNGHAHIQVDLDGAKALQIVPAF